MKKYLKKETGITLVALVITIIILLILAGISIATLTSSGLFEKARLAEQESKNEQEKEKGILKDYENKIGEYINNDRQENKAIKRVQLIDTPIQITQENQEIDLKDDISNYDYLEVVLESNFAGATKPDCFQSYFINTNLLNLNYSRGYLCDIFDNYYITLNKKDNNTIYIPKISIKEINSVFINQIIGIKL